MEEILSSIKRIIAEEGEAAAQPAPRRGRADAAARSAPAIAPGAAQDEPELPAEKPAFIPMVEEVLELTDQAEPEVAMPPVSSKPVAPQPAAPQVAADDSADSILSVESEVAARHSLSALSSMLVTPRDGDNTLDGLVRSLLKPMLKEWLDARLPQLVEEMVAKEIARITAR